MGVFNDCHIGGNRTGMMRWRWSEKARRWSAGLPFYHLDQLPDGFLKQAWGTGVPSVPILLNSGNNPPPENFGGPGGIQRFMGLHEFRAAVSIDAPTLWLNAQGNPATLEFVAMAQVGTTPLRAEHLISPRKWSSTRLIVGRRRVLPAKYFPKQLRVHYDPAVLAHERWVG